MVRSYPSGVGIAPSVVAVNSLPDVRLGTQVKYGLKDVGYIYVNSDDCWMSFDRSADGAQVPDPTKFPDGFKAVADFIHGLGMKSGLCVLVP